MGKKNGRRKSPAKQPAPKPLAAKPGPVADVLKIDGDWQDAVKKSFQKSKPATGWPK